MGVARILVVMNRRTNTKMEFLFFQAEDGIRDRSPSRGLGDVYKRQEYRWRPHDRFQVYQEYSFSDLVSYLYTMVNA